MSLAVAKK